MLRNSRDARRIVAISLLTFLRGRRAPNVFFQHAGTMGAKGHYRSRTVAAHRRIHHNHVTGPFRIIVSIKVLFSVHVNLQGVNFQLMMIMMQGRVTRHVI